MAASAIGSVFSFNFCLSFFSLRVFAPEPVEHHLFVAALLPLLQVERVGDGELEVAEWIEGPPALGLLHHEAGLNFVGRLLSGHFTP